MLSKQHSSRNIRANAQYSVFRVKLHSLLYLDNPEESKKSRVGYLLEQGKEILTI